ncbi:MAG: TrkH family potassium uptake protein, partial [Hyphomicrobiales bacterium]
LLVLTVFMVPPAATDLIAANPDWQVFAGSAFVTGFLGLMLVTISRGAMGYGISVREGFVLTLASWVCLSAVAAIPFWLLEREIGLSAVDAWFEAVSGLTTTGATVLVGLDSLPPGILLWRSIIQWVGGLGVVMMAILMLPFLRVGGMQLFQLESSERGEKFVPRAGELMSLLALTYLGLTTVCTAAYVWAGMTTFDAINHAMTTIATAGFSTHDASFGHFSEPAIHWVAIVFMFAGSLPLLLFARAVKTGSLKVWNDDQVKAHAKIVLTVIFGLTAWYMIRTDAGPADALRIVSLNTVSVITTTGYALGDYSAWAPGAAGVFFVLMFIGGCSGSTCGGMKTFRLQIMTITAISYLKRLISPNRVVVSAYGGRQITGDVSAAVLAFVSVMFATVMMFTVALSLFGLDFETALSAATSAVTNVGPGLGATVGPAGNFSSLPDGAKILLSIAMLLGRLEFFTVLVVFSRDFWR